MVRVVAPRGFRDRIKWRDPIHPGRCEARDGQGRRCIQRGVHLHEIVPRSVARHDAFTWDNCRWVCVVHHDLINVGLISKEEQRGWPIEPEPGDGYDILCDHVV